MQNFLVTKLGQMGNGILNAFAHLAQFGHQEILHIAGPQSFSTSKGRAKSIESACQGHSIKLTTVEAKALTVEQGEIATSQLLDQPNRTFTAIQASTDLLALGALRAIRKHGLRCPEDMSVVGFNDMPFAEEFSPGLTTVRVPLEDIGNESARQLMRALEEKTVAPIVVNLPVELIVRASTGPAKK